MYSMSVYPCQALRFAHATFHIISTSAFPKSWLFSEKLFPLKIEMYLLALVCGSNAPTSFQNAYKKLYISASVGVPINSVIELNWCTHYFEFTYPSYDLFHIVFFRPCINRTTLSTCHNVEIRRYTHHHGSWLRELQCPHWHWHV